MESIFKWRDEWLLGIPTLDDQHRVLADCLHRLVSECAKLHGPDSDGNGDALRNEALMELMEELCTRTRSHFGIEEELMLNADYPGYTEHRREHVMLLAELKSTFATRLKDGCCHMNPETLHALKSWFIVHVAHSDRQFANWLNERDIPAARQERPEPRGKPLH